MCGSRDFSLTVGGAKKSSIEALRPYVDHQNYFAPLLQQGQRKHPGSGQESDVSQSLGACVDGADAAALASKGEL